MSSKRSPIPAVKGTHDILPEDVGQWQYLENTAQRLFELYGYREIRTPVFEATELFQKGTGESSDIVTKEMYTFLDKAGRSLTLRPEYTPSIARAIIGHRLNLKPDPMRYYFIGPMFRYDKPQKGRYRQFHQVDVEVFNEMDPAIDAEIVEMADSLLKELQVTKTKILVNSVGCRECRGPYHEALRAAAEGSGDDFCEDCRRKTGTNPLRIFDCKVDGCREKAEELPKITDYLCDECREHFKKFCSHLDYLGISYVIEPKLVRGLDYYTKTTFEFVSTEMGAQDAVLGGGRYDDLMALYGGPDICGIGFAMGVERVLSLMPYEAPPEDRIFIAYIGESAKHAGMTLARSLRREGLECLLEYRSRGLRNQLGRANKVHAAWTVIIGEDEIKSGRYQLKNMSTGDQDAVKREDIIDAVKKS
jgi:histidyl-tRNA synthetase